MDSVPIGNGPKKDEKNGSAVVHTLISGIETEYAIKAQKDESKDTTTTATITKHDIKNY